MSIVMAILGLISKTFGEVFADVLKDVLKTPAKEVSVNEVRGEVVLDPSPASDILSDYSGMLHRS